MLTFQVQRIQVLYTVASNTPGTTLATVRAETPVAEPLEGERAISQTGSLGEFFKFLNFGFGRKIPNIKYKIGLNCRHD